LVPNQVAVEKFYLLRRDRLDHQVQWGAVNTDGRCRPAQDFVDASAGLAAVHSAAAGCLAWCPALVHDCPFLSASADVAVLPVLPDAMARLPPAARSQERLVA
jgi:hypothetical protein